MQKRLLVITVMLLLSAGCTRLQNDGKPAAAPPAVPQVSQAAPPAATPDPPSLTPLPTEPIDYYRAGFDWAHPPELPLTANACRTATGGALQLQVSDVQWRPHPLAPDKFQAPSAVFTACNGDLTRSGEQSVTLLRADGTEFGPFFFLPGLEPGQALGPVRLYANTGVTARAGALLQQDGQLWPALALRAGAAGPAYPVRRSLEPAGREAPGGMDWPAAPALAELRGLALDSVTFSPDGKRQVELFLYDPKARYTLNTAPSCASVPGMVDADGQHWSFWASIDGGTPIRAGEAGSFAFPGERGLYKETTTVGGTTYLYLEQYMGCANANVTEVFAFDQMTMKIWRPQMKLETGEKADAVGLATPDGKLHRSYYANAGQEVGLHRITYAWDAQARLWVTESHEWVKH